MRDNYDEVDHGEDAYGIRWQVGIAYPQGGGSEVHVYVGDALAVFGEDDTERGRFAEAVARAVTPGVDGG